MQMMIEIDEDIFTRLFDNGVETNDDLFTITKSIRNGTPLPKGHGRLIDADKLEEDMNDALKNSLSTYEAKVFVEFMNYVDDAPTILEANKEDE